jgi:hypothetical protein
VLITAGVVWLLFSLDVLTDDNARVLSLLWPILLVGVGVDLLLGRRSLAIGALVGVVTVGIIIVLMVVGPSAGWVKGGELQTKSLTTAVGQATSAQVEIDSGPYSSNVHALAPSTGPERPLLAANVFYRGSLHFESSGGADTSVTLESRSRGWWFPWWDEAGETPWDIGLDPDTPIALKVDSGSGSSALDLSGLTLSSLEIDMSSGDAHVSLPRDERQTYPTRVSMSSGDLSMEIPAEVHSDVNIDMSSGDTTLTVGQDVDGSLSFEGSSGEFTLELTAGQACRIEVRRVSSGDVELPAGLVQVSKGDRQEGVWETQGYADATRRLLITIEISSGDVVVR